jgi:hypothetical protein
LTSFTLTVGRITTLSVLALHQCLFEPTYTPLVLAEAFSACCCCSCCLILQDLYNQLRPRLVQSTSYAEAAAAVSDILAKEAAASASGLEPIEEEESDDEEERGGAAAAAADADAAAGLAGTAEDEEDVGSGDGLDEYERGDEQGLAAAVDDEFEREYMSLLQVGCKRWVVVQSCGMWWLLPIREFHTGDNAL